jgi:hypothetical protein
VSGLNNFGSPLATAGGLALPAVSRDLRLRAHDARTGEVITQFDRRAGMYFYCLMFMQRITSKKFLATTLSVCLLGMSLICIAVCAERIENSAAANAHVLNKTCAGEGCPVKASITSTLPERSFLSPGFDDGVIRRPPVFHSELISGESELRSHRIPSFDPPFERLRVLRI